MTWSYSMHLNIKFLSFGEGIFDATLFLCLKTNFWFLPAHLVLLVCWAIGFYIVIGCFFYFGDTDSWEVTIDPFLRIVRGSMNEGFDYPVSRFEVFLTLVSYGLLPDVKMLHLSSYPCYDSSMLRGLNRLVECGEIES